MAEAEERRWRGTSVGRQVRASAVVMTTCKQWTRRRAGTHTALDTHKQIDALSNTPGVVRARPQPLTADAGDTIPLCEMPASRHGNESHNWPTLCHTIEKSTPETWADFTPARPKFLRLHWWDNYWDSFSNWSIQSDVTWGQTITFFA